MSRDLRNKVKKLTGAVDETPTRVHSFVPVTELRELLKREAKPVLENILATATASRDKSDVPSLTKLHEFVVDKACKIFGILLIRSKPERIVAFYNDKFGDDMLPVRTKIVSLKNDDAYGTIESRPQADGTRRELHARWEEVEAEDFPKHQWPFLAPIFERDKFRYTFEEQEYLPLVQGPKELKDNKDRNYSWVHEWSVHKDYVEFWDEGDKCFDRQGNPRVAIKKLKNPTTIMINREVDGLEIMRNAQHDHLIKATAYYQYKGDHFFMFPFAEQGNLWEFWTNVTKKKVSGEHGEEREKLIPENVPILDRPYLKWVFAQLTGLAQGLERLHHLDKFETRTKKPNSDADSDSDPEQESDLQPGSGSKPKPKQTCLRHGDLKPENILCFKAKHQVENGIPDIRFVITDLGLAAAHVNATDVRQSTQTKVSTKRYLAPEMETNPGGSLGRRFDVWSMGCLFLEFTIWVLYGPVELERCTSEISEFFELYEPSKRDASNDGLLQVPSSTATKRKRARRHLVVDGWIDYIIKDWRCAPGTALGQLIKLIDDWMLVVKVEESEDQQLSMKRATTSQNQEMGAQPADFSRKKDYRTYAPGMVKDLEAILFGLRGTMEVMGVNPGGETPKGPSKATSSGVGAPIVLVERPNEYRFTPLSDDWDYTPDSTFAKRVFADLDWQNYVPREAKSKLCKRCTDDLQLWSIGCYFYDSPSKFDFKAYTEGCLLCSLLSSQLKKRKADPEKVLRFDRIGSYIMVSDGLAQPVANLYKTPQTNVASLRNIPIGFLQLPRAGSLTHLKVLKEWLRQCDEQHSCFPVDINFTPTRLIDVGDLGSDTVRLLDLGQTQPTKQDERYIALSHRWGAPQHHAKFCTYKSNIDSFKHGIVLSQLPQTFQDAILVTRGLGVRRLWIDSICIVQDDPDDWDHESKFMERVFSSSYCTLAASCASGSSDGFLKPRPTRRCIAMRTSGENSTYYVCDTIDDFNSHVEQSELNQRGWVLQERALSRRTIYFTEMQTYWECGGGIRCETMTMMKNRKASFLGDADFPRSADEYVKGMKIELFQDLYERYSRLALSFPFDRPVAIKGLETRLMDTFGTTGGYGIFDVYLHRCLLWQRAVNTLTRIPSSRGIPIPSWSWMAYDGPIRYEQVAFNTASWNPELSRPLTQADLTQTEQDKVQRGADLEAPVWDLLDVARGTLVFDQGDRVATLPLQCVVIGSSKTGTVGPTQMHWVLLVQRVEGGNEIVYERIGMGILWGSQIDFDKLKRVIRIR